MFRKQGIIFLTGTALAAAVVWQHAESWANPNARDSHSKVTERNSSSTNDSSKGNPSLEKGGMPQTNLPAIDDPYAWLEGRVNCEKVKSVFSERFKTMALEDLAPLEREEYRMLADETCQNKKFASCHFTWCANVVQVKNGLIDQQQEDSESKKKILQTLADRTKGMSVHESPVDIKAQEDRASLETEKGKISVPPAPRFRLQTIPEAVDVFAVNNKSEERPVALEESVPQVENISASTASPEAVAPRVSIGLTPPEKPQETKPTVTPVSTGANPMKGLDPFREAERQLLELVEKKKAGEQRAITASAAREKSKGYIWQTITVPGAERPKTVVHEQLAGEDEQNAPGVIARSGQNTRTIAPNIDPRAQRAQLTTQGGRVGTFKPGGEADEEGTQMNNTPGSADERSQFQKILQKGKFLRDK